MSEVAVAGLLVFFNRPCALCAYCGYYITNPAAERNEYAVAGSSSKSPLSAGYVRVERGDLGVCLTGGK